MYPLSLRQKDKLQIFAGFAGNLASLSNCKRAQCGAIIFPGDFSSVLSVGYNGPPKGVSNDYCTSLQGGCGCVHAEANALIKLTARPREDEEFWLFATTMPCYHCAGLIINSQNISRVIWLHEYRDKRGLDVLENAGIPHNKLRDLLS